MTSGSSNGDTVAGEFEASSESRFVQYHCTQCRATTKHLRDPSGVLHCRRCVLQVSAAPSLDQLASDDSAQLPATEPPARPRGSRGISRAVMGAVLAVAVLAIAALVAYVTR